MMMQSLDLVALESELCSLIEFYIVWSKIVIIILPSAGLENFMKKNKDK